MDELIKMISDKTGLPPEQARRAAEVAIEFIKGRLPASIASNLDGLISGGSAASGGGAMGDITSKLGGMFG